ncbi:hypothetical protein [Marichromatium gracile]|uniref:Uncharacterized protein n=1 Tax=Marichromatium gracile TaxID=1048 RepID=A0A4R4A4J1_MARGR|nr:hypothetical protein [Marichromatium gracile]TCW32668.1 hypothetical protein EDC29_11734 [Marichromatium gracile]
MDRTIDAELLRLAEHARAVARHAGARWRALEYRGDWCRAVEMRRAEARLIEIGDWCAQQTRGGAHADHSVQ